MKRDESDLRRIENECATAKRVRTARIKARDAEQPKEARVFKTVGRMRIDLDDIARPALPDFCNVGTWALAFVSVSWRRSMEDLQAAGYSAWTPMMTRWHTHARLRERRHLPIFPGYVFVGFRMGATRAVRDIMGVQYLVSRSDGFVPISPGFIFGLAVSQALGEYDEASKTNPFTLEPVRFDPATREPIIGFTSGEPVVAWRGPYEGLGGEVVSMSDDERCIVLLRMLGAVREVSMPLDMLKRAG